MSSKENVREVFDVNFGYELLGTTSDELIRMYMFICLGDSEEMFKAAGAGNNKHVLSQMWISVGAALDNIESGNTTWDNTTPEGNLAILGSLIRQRLENDALLYQLSGANGLSTSIDSITYNGYTEVVDFAQIVAQIWFFIGCDYVNDFGQWDKTKFRKEDDCAAGIFAFMYYISFWHDMMMYSYGDMYARAVEYDSGSGLGIFRPLIPDKIETWDSWPFDHDLDFMMLYSADVNDWGLRSAHIPILKGAEERAKRLLSRTKWTWRYERWVEVIPVMLPFIDSEDVMESGDILYEAHPLNDAGDYFLFHFSTNWRQLIARIQNKFWSSKVMGELKQYWELKRLIDLKIPEGQAGLMWHQCSAVAYESNVGTDGESIGTKFKPATNLGGVGGTYTDTAIGIGTGEGRGLLIKKDIHTDWKFEVIGDVPLDDMLVVYGLSAIEIDTDMDGDADSDTILGGEVIIPIKVKGWEYCAISKSESRGEYIQPNHVSGFDSKDDIGWQIVSMPWLWIESAETEAAQETRIYGHMTKGHALGPSVALNRRSMDPYKKLDHHYHDGNVTDVDAVRDLLVNLFVPQSRKSEKEVVDPVIPVSAVSKEKEEVKTSAVSSGDDFKKEDEEKFEVEDDKKIGVSAVSKEKIEKDKKAKDEKEKEKKEKNKKEAEEKKKKADEKKKKVKEAKK